MMDDAKPQKFQKQYKDGQIIFCEVEMGNSFYFIKAGEVKLFRMIDGKESIVDVLETGSFFGEMAIIESAPRSATAIASGEVTLLEFSRDNFESVVLQNPQMALRLVKTFVKRINTQKQRLHVFSFKNTTARIIACLLNLMVREKEQHGDVQHVVKSSVDDIAKWVRFPVKDVNKVLQSLSAVNIVIVHKDRVSIRDKYELKRRLMMYSDKNILSTNVKKDV